MRQHQLYQKWANKDCTPELRCLIEDIQEQSQEVGDGKDDAPKTKEDAQQQELCHGVEGMSVRSQETKDDARTTLGGDIGISDHDASSCAQPYFVGSKVGGSDSTADFHIAV
ncbi:hypothetical protein LSAT2_024877 [Lamellibrachia satsuma]|nr:hypothetical protein LSAT2_024877 [Lamellibrachia satsuma]